MAGVLALTGPTANTSAAFSDTTVVTSGQLRADTVLSPASVDCISSGLLAPLVFAWINPDLRYTFLVTLEWPVGTVRETRYIANNGTVGSQQSTSYSPSLLQSLAGLGVTVTVRVRSSLSGAATWVSTPGVTASGEVVSLLGLGLSTSCN